MENRLEDFTAGIQATFGQLARSTEELQGFLRAAEEFYLEVIGISRPSTSEQSINDSNSGLPFWRYFIFYATLALDQAAESKSEEEAAKYKDIASELSSCWPLLSILITQQYAAPTEEPQLDLKSPSQSIMHGSPGHGTGHGTSAGTSLPSSKVDTAMQTDSSHEFLPRPRMLRHPSVMRTVEAVTPPIHDAGEENSLGEQDDITVQASQRQVPAIWDSYLDRASGRSLSASTQLTNSSISSYPSDILYTPILDPSQSPYQFRHDRPSPASTPMGRSFSSSPGPSTRIPEYAQIRSDSTTPTLNTYHQPFNPSESFRADGPAKVVSSSFANNFKQAIPTRQNTYNSPQNSQIKLLLADRGDNTAKLVPTPDGSYILDISIGGRKLLVHPERPAEIQYHDAQGAVVTQSLLSSAIHAQ